MERWTYLIIAGPDGAATQMRVFLRTGDDPAAWPATQFGLDGGEVPVDEAPHDYEAPEWKAAQILDPGTGGQGQVRIDRAKDQLRSMAKA